MVSARFNFKSIFDEMIGVHPNLIYIEERFFGVIVGFFILKLTKFD